MLSRTFRSKWTTLTRSIACKNENLSVRAKLHENPEKIFLVHDTRSITYGEFLKRCGQYVSTLSDKYGVGRGDRVLSRTSKSLDSIALYMACIRLGAIYVPVNPIYTHSEISHYVQDSSPKLIVTCDERIDSVFKECAFNVVPEQTLAMETRRSRIEMDVENVESNDVACICYTSGTTGKPKGAMLTHGSISTNAEELVHLWKFTHDDKLLHMLPFYHVHGLLISLNCSLFSHSSVIWRERFSVDDCLRWMPQSTVMMGVPTYYSRLISSPYFTWNSYNTIRLFVSGSAPLPMTVWKLFQEKTGQGILERYGMTEAQVICSNLYEAEGRRPGFVGKPIRGTKLRLNKFGGIEIKSSSLFGGYWNNVEKTKQEFTSDGFFITGDIGQLDEDGFVRILGRNKDIVITGGLNVYPKEIEDKVDEIDEVAESAIIGAPHKDLGEGVVAIISLKDTIIAKDKDMEPRIIKHLKEQLASYKVPKRVVILPNLPKNSMAKVQKNVLREQFKYIFK